MKVIMNDLHYVGPANNDEFELFPDRDGVSVFKTEIEHYLPSGEQTTKKLIVFVDDVSEEVIEMFISDDEEDQP